MTDPTPRTVSRGCVPLAALAVALMAGCSLFLDTSGLDTEDAPPAGSDASTGDASAPSDGGVAATDGAVAAGGGDGGFDCARIRKDTRVVLCDDFSGRTDPVLGWSFDDKQGTGALVIDTASNDPFLRSTTSVASGAAKASLFKIAARPQRRVEVGARIRFASYPSTGVQTATIQMGLYPNSKIIVLHATSGGLAVFEQAFGQGAGFFQYTPSANLDSGTWGRAELSLDFTTQPATIGLALNGASVLSRGSQLGLAPTDEVRVGVGVTYTDPSPAFEMGTDDVVVTLE